MVRRRSVALALAVAGVSVPAFAGWDGPYLGASGGGGWGQQSQAGGILVLPGTPSTTSSSSFTANADGNYNLSGGLVGGTVGYNFQTGQYVFGLEGDGSWANISGSGTCGFGGASPHPCGGDVDALGTVRGRLGYDLGMPVRYWGDVLAYATGGLAVGGVHGWDSLFGTSGSKTVTGWTVGGGLETMLNRNWSLSVEYLYVDLGNPVVFSAIPPQGEHVSTQFNILRLGLNYHFDWAPPPMVTKAPLITK